MSIIKVVYFSGSGNTKSLAESVNAGASKSAESELMEITGEMIVNGRFKNDDFLEKLDQADAMIFGTPTWVWLVGR